MPQHTWQNPAHLHRCQGKRRYSSMHKAEIEADRASDRAGELIIAYRCPDCRKFHVGHADKHQLLARGGQHAPSCLICGQPIPLATREKATANGSEIVYCSGACQKEARRRRRMSRIDDFSHWLNTKDE
jgi:hypothetical protein